MDRISKGAAPSYRCSAELQVTCDFSNVEENTDEATAADSGGYYRGARSDVPVVFDPSLGFTAGGGTYFDPLSGDRVNFGYTMRYNKKQANVQGSLLVIRHGEDGVYRQKLNCIDGQRAAGLSMPHAATDNAMALSGGNLVVPHQGGGGGTKKY